MKKACNRWWRLPCRNSKLCQGPCYDFCACAHCWAGWDRLSWRRKILNRIKYIFNLEG